MKRVRLFLALAISVSGCGDPAYHSLGATPGGTQDIRMARSLVEAGQVPPPETFIIEGLFSEHDLPIGGQEPCARTLCLSSAVAVTTSTEGQRSPSTWVQVGLSSNVDREAFQRSTLAAVLLIDESGSMGNFSGEESPGAIARATARALVEQLGPEDDVAIITFADDADLRLAWTHAQDPEIHEKIDALQTRGGTNFEAGLKMAVRIAAAAPTRGETRIFVVTDAQPNIGETRPGSFSAMARDAAAQGIGLTLVGAGLGLDVTVMDGMAQLRGGNAFSLMETNDVPNWIEDNWPWMVSPIAFDLILDVQTVTTASTTRVVEAYGFPENGQQGLEVATVFLSNRRGALLLEINGADSGSGATIDFRFENAAGDVETQQTRAQYEGQTLDASGAYWPGTGVRKTVALARLGRGMRQSARHYQRRQREAAIQGLRAVLEEFGRTAEALDDPALDREAQFWPRLLELMESGAPQGTLYD